MPITKAEFNNIDVPPLKEDEAATAIAAFLDANRDKAYTEAELAAETGNTPEAAFNALARLHNHDIVEYGREESDGDVYWAIRDDAEVVKAEEE